MWPFRKPPTVDETENQVETPILQNRKEIFCPHCGELVSKQNETHDS